jgi:hypothetical protein
MITVIYCTRQSNPEHREHLIKSSGLHKHIFDGMRHYKSVKHFGGDKIFVEQQLKDKIKSDYCIKNKLIKIKEKIK